MFQIEPWHWFLFGVALAVAEIFLPSFTIFWFGIAAVMVSGLLWVFPDLSFTVQIGIWIILSLLITVLWFKFIKPLSKDHLKQNLSREAAIGQVGMVIALIPEHHEVKVRFPMPVLGTDEWICRCTEDIKIGDRIVVTDILGNQFVVIPHTSTPS